MTELKTSHDRDKSRLVSSYKADKEAWEIEREHELDTLRQSMRAEVGHVEALANERQARDAQVVLFIQSTYALGMHF